MKIPGYFLILLIILSLFTACKKQALMADQKPKPKLLIQTRAHPLPLLPSPNAKIPTILPPPDFLKDKFSQHTE